MLFRSTGYLRVNVNSNCIQVDFIRTYLPADTLSGLHHNGEVGFSYTIGNCTSGISSVDGVSMPTLYPNPAQTYFHVKNFETNGKNFVQLYDATGRIVLTSYNEETSIASLKSGYYTVRIENNGTTTFQKLLINR